MIPQTDIAKDTVTYRYIPLHTITDRYQPLPTVTITDSYPIVTCNGEKRSVMVTVSNGNGG
jgi:hypothetical protein